MSPTHPTIHASVPATGRVSFSNMLSTAPKQVSFQHEDRQWDCRFNVQTDNDLETLLTGIRSDYERGRLKYILVGGVEIGTRPYQDDYQVRHVHVAAIFHNRVSKRAILKNWNVKEGNGYYLVPRNRDLPYSGWKSHHTKEFSKTDASSLTLYEMGTLPEDLKRKRIEASEEEKKSNVNDILIELKEMIEKGDEEPAFKKYPRTYLQYGEKIKAMVIQKKDLFKTEGHPHIWLHGFPGTGKTAILNYIYPKSYKKNLYNKFFDLYNPEVHTHVLLEDLDYEAVDRLSINFLKTICDEAGFSIGKISCTTLGPRNYSRTTTIIDQKYKTPQLTRTTCLVTSNFTISEILTETKGIEVTKAAFYRRFWHVCITELLRLLGIKLLPKFERNKLKKEGNDDTAKLFMGWDYLTDSPTCTPLRSPEEYQKIIKDHYYA